ncbi:MAG TPA: GFA family protein [Gammaproteobacteria bacterium]|nr:GFA family protein [Gammaproteobacteria bacterium]
MYPGGCECKSVRYQFNGEPLTCYACHCTDCQTSSGSAFGMSMIVHDRDLEIIEGEVAISTGDMSGVEVRRHHCAHCGTAFWFSADAYPGIVALRPGTFDDTSWFKPVAHLWVHSAQAWVRLDEDVPQYEKQPEISELIDLWARRENT